MGSNFSSEENLKMADSTSQPSANQQWPVNIIPKESQQQQVKINFADEAGVDEIIDISAKEVRLKISVKFIFIFCCKVYLFKTNVYINVHVKNLYLVSKFCREK